jgi:glycosyltransferase involved in cell wall biosynthesis
MKPVFIISCPIETYSGYGARSRDIVKAIIELDKYDVKILSQRWGNTPWGFLDDNPKWNFLKNHIVLPQQITQKPDIWLQITIPSEFQPMGKYNIGVTAGIETTVCHHSWVEGINRMDTTWVSSNHAKTVFENCIFEQKHPQTQQVVGVIQLQKPIEVVFEGADLETYLPTKDNHFDLDQIKENFAFLFVGHWMQGQIGEDRKNVGLMIKAFLETFKNQINAPALILKTSGAGSSYMDRDLILDKIHQVKSTVNAKTLPSIYLLHGEFTDEEMNGLYNNKKVKAMISLTKGEGFGRPLLEFSLTKKPIITTNWSGHIDFLKPKFTTLLGGELTNVHPSAQVKDMILGEGKWFSVNVNEVGSALLNLYKNYKPFKDNALHQASYSKSNFSYEKMKEKIGEFLEKNIPEFPQQVQLQLPKLQLPKLKKVETNEG